MNLELFHKEFLGNKFLLNILPCTAVPCSSVNSLENGTADKLLRAKQFSSIKVIPFQQLSRRLLMELILTVTTPELTLLQHSLPP